MERRGNFVSSGEVSYRFTDLTDEELVFQIQDHERQREQLNFYIEQAYLEVQRRGL